MGNNGDHMGRTLVAFHAHPDDEALLTSGTMARAAAEGHRVVLVVATDGGLGLAASEYVGASDTTLGSVRMAELQTSARAARHGARRDPRVCRQRARARDRIPTRPGRVRFVRADPEEAAERLAAILREEQADVLLTYDANGGYGHRDHVKVHHVGARAAELAGTPTVLQATVPRDLLVRAIRFATRIYRFPPEFDPTSFERAYSASGAVTHRVTRPPVCVAEASLDARPRLAGLRRRRGRPDVGGLPAHTASGVRPGVRPGVVRRRVAAGRSWSGA